MSDRSCNLVRWSARGSTVVLVLIILGMLFSQTAPSLSSINLPTLIAVGAFLVTIVGLLIAWRWEVLGASMAASALAMFYLLQFMINGRLPSGAVALFFVPIALFLLLALARGEKTSDRLK